ncbi:CsbD family protein [Streptomyces sp. NBC_00503]|uniref:CsbD family protein n=1 Tax=Streptomyces sp. NBC_00503 TaxID=2903659 RepID=UPI002E80BA70|nr:CsbD family protein [Streptomyces sp. NBC_00503]WUD79219.1 CsbD family protein [Streptomyces sp. NBC_00503]
MSKAKAKAKQVKGKIKEAAGDAMDDKSMQARGTAERLTGKAQEAAAKAADHLKRSKN